MKHVIIGTGPAGVTAAETLRGIDPEAEILMFGEEPGVPYARMAIPYYLNDKIAEEGTALRKQTDFYSEKHIEVMNQKVTSVDGAGKSITLDNGETVPFDRLLIASGSSPVRPNIPGFDSARVHSCWTLADARNIHRLAMPDTHVVLMGAGFIGGIILEALARRGVKLHVVEMENRMVPRMMNETSGAMLKSWCEQQGVEIYTGTSVQSIEDCSDGVKATLSNGVTLSAVLVVSAVGVQPNVDFLTGSGVDLATGVPVNDYLETNVEGIFAAGDVAHGKDFSSEQYHIQAIQPTAVDHGRIAAHNMAGHQIVHQGSLNMNILDTLGLVSASFGEWQGVSGGESVELVQPEQFRYLQLQFDDDCLVGANSVGHCDHIGVIRGLIQSKVRLGVWKARLMRNPLRLMEAYIDSTQLVS